MKNFHSNLDETKLVQSCIKGHAKSQRRLYELYSRAMYNTIIRMHPYVPEAEDILQEVFIKVYENLKNFKGNSTIGTWIKRISINTTLKYIRNRRMLSFEKVEFPDIVEEEVEDLRYDVKMIHDQIKLLPEGCRIVLNLYLFEGYQHKEIASSLNISESTSKSQYQRGRKLLQEKLKSIAYGK